MEAANWMDGRMQAVSYVTRWNIAFVQEGFTTEGLENPR